MGLRIITVQPQKRTDSNIFKLRFQIFFNYCSASKGLRQQDKDPKNIFFVCLTFSVKTKFVKTVKRSEVQSCDFSGFASDVS